MDNDLRDRLADALYAMEPWDEFERVSGAGAWEAEQWADRCLADANAAIALIEEHWPGRYWLTRIPVEGEPYNCMIPIDAHTVVDEDGATAPEAICRAFVAWREAKEVTANG